MEPGSIVSILNRYRETVEKKKEKPDKSPVNDATDLTYISRFL